MYVKKEHIFDFIINDESLWFKTEHCYIGDQFYPNRHSKESRDS